MLITCRRGSGCVYSSHSALFLNGTFIGGSFSYNEFRSPGSWPIIRVCLFRFSIYALGTCIKVVYSFITGVPLLIMK